MSFVETRVENLELPVTWSRGRLDEICYQMKQGKILPQKKIHESGSYPVFGANGCIGFCEDYFLEEQRVLITCRGSTCGVINRSPARSFVTNNAMILFEKDCLENDFLFFALQEFSTMGLKTGSGQPQLTQGILNSHKLPLPPLPEQKKIAHILSTVQRAVEAQERIIQTTTELKKALMHKLFIEGLRNEPQKQTEIGPVPESWAVVELGTLFEKQPQNGIYKHKRDYGAGTQILRIDDFSNDGDIVTKAGNLVTLARSEIETYGLEPGDIVINRVNSLSHLGKTALIGPINDEMVFESNMMRFSVDESQVRKEYVFKFLNSPLTKKQIIGTAKRAVAQSSINQGDVKSIMVPKPSLDEQGEIADALEATESKIARASDKAAVLRDLFRTLLHELMTAKTRVQEIEFTPLNPRWPDDH